MRAVNLLPEDARSRRLGTPQLVPTLGVAACVVAVGAVGVAAHVESGKVADRQQQLDALELRLAQVPKPQQHASGTTVAFLNSRGQRIAALSAAITGRVAYDRILAQLSLALPGDVWLNTLQLSAPSASTSSTTPGSPSVTIGGSTFTTDAVAVLLQRLAVMPTLSDVSLVSAKVGQVGNKNVVDFQVTANLAQAGGGQ